MSYNNVGNVLVYEFHAMNRISSIRSRTLHRIFEPTLANICRTRSMFLPVKRNSDTSFRQSGIVIIENTLLRTAFKRVCVTQL